MRGRASARGWHARDRTCGVFRVHAVRPASGRPAPTANRHAGQRPEHAPGTARRTAAGSHAAAPMRHAVDPPATGCRVGRRCGRMRTAGSRVRPGVGLCLGPRNVVPPHPPPRYRSTVADDRRAGMTPFQPSAPRLSAEECEMQARIALSGYSILSYIANINRSIRGQPNRFIPVITVYLRELLLKNGDIVRL